MKTIDCWNAMQPYGIVALTSEPDGLKHRIVCDLTAKGKQLVEKALGLISIELQPNWDYGTNDDPHIGSMLLTEGLFTIVGVYALLDDGCREVWATRHNGLIGIQQGDSQQFVADLQLSYGTEVIHRFIHSETNCNWNQSILS